MPQISDTSRPPMFAFRSLNKADMATDLAIPVMAQDGWSGVTLAAIARSGNMQRQSVLPWFGNVEGLREQVAWRYARRWTHLLSGQLSSLYRVQDPDAAWLSICDAGRSQLGIASAAAFGECEQHRLVESWLPDADQPTVHSICALITGLRGRLTDIDPISLDEAAAAVATLRR